MKARILYQYFLKTHVLVTKTYLRCCSIIRLGRGEMWLLTCCITYVTVTRLRHVCAINLSAYCLSCLFSAQTDFLTGKLSVWLIYPQTILIQSVTFHCLTPRLFILGSARPSVTWYIFLSVEQVNKWSEAPAGGTKINNRKAAFCMKNMFPFLWVIQGQTNQNRSENSWWPSTFYWLLPARSRPVSASNLN